MLDSSRVVPEAPLKAGFRFRHAELSPALRDIISS
jgi:NAD dependent epimerase/dehydratase family enzyme